MLGFCEFPFTDGRRLSETDWTIEREYWLRLRRTAELVTTPPLPPREEGFVVLHVQYAGKWTAARDKRDLQVIKQLNLRRSATRREAPYHRKCLDLNKWKGRHGCPTCQHKDGAGRRTQTPAGPCMRYCWKRNRAAAGCDHLQCLRSRSPAPQLATS